MKKVIIGVVVVIVAVGGFLFFKNSKKEDAATTETTVKLYDIKEQTPIHLKGQVVPTAKQTVMLNSEKGTVRSFNVKEGDTVAKDTVLLTYDWGETVKAERDSIVETVNEDAKNDPSKPAMVLVSQTTEIDGTVTEYDLQKLSVDMPVTIAYVTDGTEVPGTITSISKMNIESTSTETTSASTIVSYKFIAQPSSPIPLGFSVEILIPQHNMFLPSSAVEKDGDATYVYTIEDGKAKKKQVTLSEEDGNYKVVDGLVEGDKIIRTVKGIKDGVDVKAE